MHWPTSDKRDVPASMDRLMSLSWVEKQWSFGIPPSLGEWELILQCQCVVIYFGNKKRFCLESELGGRECGGGSRFFQCHSRCACQPTHVMLVPNLGTSKIVHLKVVGIGFEMRHYRDIRGMLAFYFITNVLNQKQQNFFKFIVTEWELHLGKFCFPFWYHVLIY